VVFSPADTLRGAALYLIRHGWHQGDMFDLTDPDCPFPPACGLGGIRMAATRSTGVDGNPPSQGEVDAIDQAVMAMADHLFMYYGEPDPTAGDCDEGWSWPEQVIGEWNDCPQRNRSQVVAALYGAAGQWDRVHHQPVRYDACTVCGGPYPMGPSTSPVCGTCAQAPESTDQAHTDDEYVVATPNIGGGR
jgi:hypothetical protein